MLNIFPFLLDMAPWVAGIDINSFKEIYNFDLEHWGINRAPKESLFKYYDRIGRSPLANTKNLCSWDLSLGTSSWHLSLGIFLLGSFAWDL